MKLLYPLVLLVAGLAVHYAWPLFPVAWQADVWNIAGALVRLLLLWALTITAIARLGAPVLASLVVACWFSAEEVLVAGCAVWSLIDPIWTPAGGERCTSHFGFEVGIFGLFSAALILLWLKPETFTSNSNTPEARE